MSERSIDTKIEKYLVRHSTQKWNASLFFALKIVWLNHVPISQKLYKNVRARKIIIRLYAYILKDFLLSSALCKVVPNSQPPLYRYLCATVHVKYYSQ